MNQTTDRSFPDVLYLTHDVIPTDTGITYSWTFSVAVGDRGVMVEVDDFCPDTPKIPGSEVGPLVDSYARASRIATMLARAAEVSRGL